MSETINMLTENIDSVVNDIDPKYLRGLNLTGRHGYISQGYNGSTSTVAVLDTGVNPDHPELKGKVVGNLNYVNYRYDFDDHGHGTHCAATIAGTNVGVAPGTKILSVKVLAGDGGGDIDKIIQALEDLKDWRTEDGRKLSAISMSLGIAKRFLNADQIQRFEKAVKALTMFDIPVICSAGNTGIYEDRYPAAIYDTITVGAVDAENLQPAGFTTHNKEVDVAQVGVDVLSAWYKGRYAVMSGTSMATPKVAGIASLISDKFYQVFGEHMPELVMYWMLRLNTKDIGDSGLCVKTGAGFCTLQPVLLDLKTKKGNDIMILNGEDVQMRAPIKVVSPGVTSLPARELVETCLGGDVTFDEESGWARFRL